MVTRFHVETNRPVERLTLHVSSVSPVPRSYREAFNDVNWHSAIRDEYNALIKNSTWTIVPRQPDVNVVRCMWLFRHKYLADALSLWAQASPSRLVSAVCILYYQDEKKYAVEILERAGMVHCNPSRTPVDTEPKLGTTGDVVSDLTLYQSLAGSLQYLTFTRPDISYVVKQGCLHMHDPREPHFSALKRILCYVRGTLDYGLQLFSFFTTDLVAYSDAD
ncbi:ribonuclease H-like domain-containing protein [Tanacetum coccineum]